MLVASHSPDLTDAGLASLYTRDHDNDHPCPQVGANAGTDNILGVKDVSGKSDQPVTLPAGAPEKEYGSLKEENSGRGLCQVRLLL